MDTQDDAGEITRNMYVSLANRLREFTRMAVYRILGYFDEHQYTGAHLAIRNIEEARFLLRAELNALKKILIDKGVVSHAELDAETLDHLSTMLHTFSKAYPEITVSEDGKAVIDMVGLKSRAEREHWSKVPNE